MGYIRWYDKDKYLKILVETMEHLDENTKMVVASDIIQLIIQQRGEDSDILIDKLRADYSPLKRRWYDQDETIKSAVEMLKHIDEEERVELVNEILYSLIQYNREGKLEKNEDIL